MADWSLVIFTIFMQGAVGIYLWSAIAKLRNKQGDYSTVSLVALIMAAVGMITSLLHLGVPLKAMYSVLNLGGSWLSREILLSSGFFFLVLVDFIVIKRGTKGNISTVLNWVAVGVGLLAVFSMAKIYMSGVIPAWESWNTLIDFYAATILLGGLLFVILTLGKEQSDQHRMIIISMAGVILLQAALYPSFLVGLSAGNSAAQSSAVLLSEAYGVAMAARWLLILGGAFLLILSQVIKNKNISYVYFGATALVIGIVIGRYLFYAAGLVLGIG